MPLSLHNDFFMTSVAFFIRLFRDDFLDDSHHLFVAFRSVFFISPKTVTHTLFFIFVVSRPDHINILGVARDLLWRFRGVDLKDDDWRQS